MLGSQSMINTITTHPILSGNVHWISHCYPLLQQVVRPVLTGILCVLLLLMGSGLSANETTKESANAALWQAVKTGEAVAILRHALAPGTGDPANFTVDNCQTQRNLSARGREQSAAIGQLFKKAGISTANLYSSQWCRCLETARLMALGDVNPLPIINSFFRQPRAVGQTQTRQLKQWLVAQSATQYPLVLVTHQVNITGLTGIFPSSGEIIVIQRPQTTEQPIKVLGSIETL